MALTPRVDEQIQDALASLRGALAYAARNERVTTCQSISKIMLDLESISRAEALMDTLENYRADGKDGKDNLGFDFGN